ncbi:hypothetical protein IMZ48_20475 [Candidatus Bathyarchaeota archaeon]|nr:hypothetical protein [Candidatus Bathyarchaeota archaeon]
MARDRHHPDDETVPGVTWWLLNGGGRPPTWGQLERGAVARRRGVPWSCKEVRGKEVEDGGETREAGEGDLAEDAATETARSKPGKAGKKAGAGAFGRLMNRLRKQPKRPPSDVDQRNGAIPEGSQDHEDKSRSDTL